MKKLSILFVLVLGALWGVRAINANAQVNQPQYTVSPNLFQDGQSSDTICEFQRFGTITRLICDRREPRKCDRTATAAESADSDDTRTRVLRNGCARDDQGVTSLRAGDLQVVRGGRTEIVRGR